MKIKFHQDTWVLKEYSGGLSGAGGVRAVMIKPEPFEVMSVETNNEINYSTILVYTDDFLDGYTTRILNVPNCLFEALE